MREGEEKHYGLAALFAGIGLIFWANVPALFAGHFAATGLPPATIPLHAFANGLEGTGWFAVAFLTLKGRFEAASWLGYFCAGLWAWDMVTTAYLPAMPVPPHQWLWGPISVLLMCLALRRLVHASAGRVPG